MKIKTAGGKVSIREGETLLRIISISQQGLRGASIYIPSLYLQQAGIKPGKEKVALFINDNDELFIRPISE